MNHKCTSFNYFYYQPSASSDNDDSSAEESGSASEDEDEFENELDRYLGSRRVKNVQDPLKWWYDHRDVYPCLWRMARDYLTVPGMYSVSSFHIYKLTFLPASSVAVECVFSKGRLLLPHVRNQLSAIGASWATSRIQIWLWRLLFPMRKTVLPATRLNYH